MRERERESEKKTHKSNCETVFSLSLFRSINSPKSITSNALKNEATNLWIDSTCLSWETNTDYLQSRELPERWQITNRRIRRQLSSDLLTLFIRWFFFHSRSLLRLAVAQNDRTQQKLTSKLKKKRIIFPFYRDTASFWYKSDIKP